jgi:arsenite oxidase small subunit
MTDNDSQEPEKSPKPSDEEKGRRQFLKFALSTSVVLVLAGLAGVTRVLWAPGAPETSGTGTTQTSATLSFPRIKVVSLSSLAVNTPVNFNYPLEETPNILVKLGSKVDGGVGPDSDIIAYSNVCQHLGCIYGYVKPGEAAPCNPSFTASGPVGYCCCHGSVFDFANEGAVLAGPSPRPSPRVILEFDSSTGDIFATGMTPPSIFGHSTGSNDVSNDLQGGTIVS